MAANEMVVDQTHGLHEGVGGDWADEAEASSLECLRESPAFHRLGGEVAGGGGAISPGLGMGRE